MKPETPVANRGSKSQSKEGKIPSTEVQKPRSKKPKAGGIKAEAKPIRRANRASGTRDDPSDRDRRTTSYSSGYTARVIDEHVARYRSRDSGDEEGSIGGIIPAEEYGDMREREAFDGFIF